LRVDPVCGMKAHVVCANSLHMGIPDALERALQRTHLVSQNLRVDGSASLYRLHDIGYSIALDRAGGLLGADTGGRSRPSRQDARAIEIRNPPLLAVLRSFDMVIGGGSCAATISAHLFDFGVCSLRLSVAASPNLTWDEFAEFAAGFDAAPDVAGLLDAELRELTSRIAGAIDRPATLPVTEEYKVYRIDRLENAGGEARVSDLLSDARLAALLLGERRPLSELARRELVPYRFSYYEDDLTVLTWESALVVEPRAEDRDVEFVLEFANAQLLELRVYNFQLDASLPALYDRAEAARAGRSPRLAGRFRAVLSELQTRVADITETVEHVENAFKVTDDVYLARIYTTALQLFREQTWRRGIDRKLGILRDTYMMLNGEAQTARAELLEIAIIVLIVMELILGVLQGAHR
jgi:hypothetical protein